MKYDNVEHPLHYNQYPHEVIELTENLGFCLGNAVKYILRAPFKGKEVEDLQKAKWYLNRIKDEGDLSMEIPEDEEIQVDLVTLAATYGDKIVLNLIRAAAAKGWMYTPAAELEDAIEKLDFRISDLVDKEDDKPAEKPTEKPAEAPAEDPKKAEINSEIDAVIAIFTEFANQMKRI